MITKARSANPNWSRIVANINAINTIIVTQYAMWFRFLSSTTSENRIPAAKRVEIAITHLMTVGCVYEGWNPIAVMIPKESQTMAFRSINR